MLTIFYEYNLLIINLLLLNKIATDSKFVR